MTVTVYVEGKSDRLALEALLASLLSAKRDEGIDIRFFEAPAGDRKNTLLTKVPIKALSILRNQPDSFVVIVPDLYPPNKGFPHVTKQELVRGVQNKFNEEAARKGLSDLPNLSSRFQVFCFKHDMEVLLLAARENLAAYLNCSAFAPDWNNTVEDQNHDNPPSKIVGKWFAECGRRYDKTMDARAILSSADYRTIAQRCPQCFKPFVDFLEGCGGQAT